MSRHAFRAVLLLGLISCTLPSIASAAEKRTENTQKSSTPKLTKKNGPWMIMACSFTVYNTEEGVGPDYRKIVEEQRANGEKAARQLAAELEKLGLPAFVYQKGDEIEEVRTSDRLGQTRVRKIRSQHGQTCVLAGNFDSYDDPKAQEWLKKLKTMRPKALENGLFQAHSDKFGPMGGAFMTTNPLISSEELANLERSRDPLIKKLNSGSEYSLLKNPGRYTLVLATFKGKSQGISMSAPKEEVNRKILSFDKKLATDVSLDKAGYEAWSMAKTLRNQKQEAYVYHDRDRSIVTLGSFETTDDPRLLKLAERMKARYITDSRTGKQVLTCEMVSIPNRDPNAPPEKFWLIDPAPLVMPVPKIK